MTEINSAKDAHLNLSDIFNPYAEECWALCLNHQMQLIKKTMIHRGTANYCLIHPRDLFREAIGCNSYALIVAHNHTTHLVQPSDPDIVITKKLMNVSKLLDIPLLDHIIFNKSTYYSFKENRNIFK